MRLLIIGDPHAHPDYSNERFGWLGQYICQVRPDTIVCMGDFADMASLSSYDKGKGTAEGRRVKKDLEAAEDALKKLEAPIATFNQKRRAAHKAAYNPRKLITLGNHEYRINRAANQAPELLDFLSPSSLPFERHGWEVYPYQQPVVVGGFAFVHEHSSARGKTPARGLVLGGHMSAVVGHIHKFDHHTATRLDGSRIQTIVSGCYAHADYKEDWCAAHRHTWTEGVILLDGVEEGDYASLTFVQQAELRRRFG